MLVDAVQATLPAPRAPSVYASPAGPSAPVTAGILSPADTASPADTGEDVVVTARGNEQFRLRPITPPETKPSFFKRPLHIQIAPGVSVGGASAGVGSGLHIEFGPGRKSGEKAQQPPPSPQPTPAPDPAD